MAAAPPYSVSVIIPVLNAAKFLPELLSALSNQQPAPPLEIIIIDSGSQDETVALATRERNVHVLEVKKFSHGGTRNWGIAQAQGDLVVLMTQDALPARTDWLHELTAPFRDPRVAATFSRQIPRDTASPMERFFLATHFPEAGKIYARRLGQQDLAFQRDVFLANVAAALRREIAIKHPFESHLIMSEDQQFARDVLMADFVVAYVPSSLVRHSHNYTCVQAFKRYFDGAYSLTQIFSRHDLRSSLAMGSKYLRREAWMMLCHHPRWLMRYAGYVAAKTTGTLLGHFADNLPLWLKIRASQNAGYWHESHQPAGAVRRTL